MRARGAAAGSSRCYTITCGRDGGEPRHPRSPALPSREHRHPRSRAIALPRRAPASPDPGCSLAGGVGGWGARGNRLCRSASVSLPGGHRHPRLSPSRGASIPGYHPHRGAPHPRPPGYCPPGAPASPAITLTGGGAPHSRSSAIALPGRRHPRLPPRWGAPAIPSPRGTGSAGPRLSPPPPSGGAVGGGGTTTPASPVPGYPLLGEGGGAPAFPVPGCPSPRVAPVPATPLPRSRPGQRRTWGAGAGAGLGGGSSGTGARRLADERRSCWGCPGRPLIAGAEPALGFLELRGFL